MKDLSNFPVLRFLKAITNFAWYTFIVLGTLITVLLIFVIIFDPHDILTNESIEIPVMFDDFDSTTDAESLTRDFRIVELSMLTGMLYLKTDRIYYWILMGMGGLISFVIVLFVIYQFRKIFENLTTEQPFTRDNIIRIQTIGIALIAVEVFVWFSFYAITYYMSDMFVLGRSDFSFSQEFSWMTVLAGLIVLLIAEIFKVGSAMHEDQKLTV